MLPNSNVLEEALSGQTGCSQLITEQQLVVATELLRRQTAQKQVEKAKALMDKTAQAAQQASEMYHRKVTRSTENHNQPTKAQLVVTKMVDPRPPLGWPMMVKMSAWVDAVKQHPTFIQPAKQATGPIHKEDLKILYRLREREAIDQSVLDN